MRESAQMTFVPEEGCGGLADLRVELDRARRRRRPRRPPRSSSSKSSNRQFVKSSIVERSFQNISALNTISCSPKVCQR